MKVTIEIVNSGTVTFLIKDKLNKDFSYEYRKNTDSDICVASARVPYGVSFQQYSNGNNLLAELIRLLPLLQLNEQILLMSRLASIIEKETCFSNKPVIKTKKLKKIPDAEYNVLLDSEETQKRRAASLASIREMLKNDEW